MMQRHDLMRRAEERLFATMVQNDNDEKQQQLIPKVFRFRAEFRGVLRI